MSLEECCKNVIGEVLQKCRRKSSVKVVCVTLV